MLDADYHEILPCRLVHVYTPSDELVADVLQMLEICTQEHESCNPVHKHGPFLLPARLIEITQHESSGDGNILSVKLTRDVTVWTRYTCLSHCWGPSRFICTDKSNLEDFHHGINWQTLPQTFQEAISFTYRLGLRYIWIDSLCICQDDALDWRHEGSKMDSIYAGAHLTLAASASSSVHGGLFGKQPVSLVVPASMNELNLQSVLGSPKMVKHEDLDSKNLPLTHRAWTFQERLLSTRVVHFGPSEILWECMEDTWCQCSLSNGRALTANFTRPWLHRKDEVFSQTNRIRDSELWHDIVRDFTARALTYEKDIFPALQGVAKRLGARTSSAYYAGLWDVTLVADLLWTTKRARQGRRPQSWRAPSWSWASVIGEVTWEHVTVQEKISILHCSVVPIGDDYFGELLSGCIRLRGRCMRGVLVPRPSEISQAGVNATFHLCLKSAHGLHADTLDCYFDHEFPAPRLSQLAFWVSSLACDGCVLDKNNLLCSEHSILYEEHILQVSEDLVLMYIACCSLTQKRFFLVLRCVNVITQEYERIGLAKSQWNGAAFEGYDQYLEQMQKTITVV